MPSIEHALKNTGHGLGRHLRDQEIERIENVRREGRYVRPDPEHAARKETCGEIVSVAETLTADSDIIYVKVDHLDANHFLESLHHMFLGMWICRNQDNEGDWSHRIDYHLYDSIHGPHVILEKTEDGCHPCCIWEKILGPWGFH